MERPPRSKITPTQVILHCTATPDFKEDDKMFDAYGLYDIDKWHRDKGFIKCGYHYVVRRSGEIEEGRELYEKGAHCLGYNHNSIGVAYVGTKEPTVAQLDSLVKIYYDLRKKFFIEYKHWYGHYENNLLKECPGFSMNLFRQYLRFAYKT